MKLSPIVLSFPVSWGMSLLISPFICELTTARLAVVVSTECRVAGMLLSPRILFREIRIESSLGNISCTLGMSCATLSIIPLFSLPGIVSPTAYFSRGLLARRMFMRTPPINSDTSSALLPLGIRSSVSSSTSTITFPGFT